MNPLAQSPLDTYPNLITILGPTACGKTRLGVEAARLLGGEIISADSRQVFRGMDIGTGKDLAEYDGVPYHLLDILEPGDEFSVFDFQRHFRDAFNLITERGHLPFLVGGTGLYLDAILRAYQLVAVPENAELRSELSDLNLEELQQRLLALSPQQHNTTDLLHRERLIRAIEIANFAAQGGVAETIELPPLRPLVFGIRMERQLLRQRITARLQQRLQEGMIDEVQRLLDNGVTPERLDAYGLEYRFVSRYLRKELNRNDMFQKLNAAIHDFAKRQETWFRRMEKHGAEIIWLDATDPLPGLLAAVAARSH